MKKFKRSLFIFRRDLRLQDNTALIAALENSEEVIPAFIFDPRQIEKNSYKSNNAIQFMIESLTDLDQQLGTKGGRLFVFCNTPEKTVEDLVLNENVNAVYFNRDYTPFALQRDAAISSVCEKHGIALNMLDDYLLAHPGQILKPDGTPYTVFTPFYRSARKNWVVPEVNKTRRSNYFRLHVKGAYRLNDAKPDLINNQNLFTSGGRTAAKKLLRKIPRLENYDEMKNFPSIRGTTGLSAHHKFGTVSIREVYNEVVKYFGESHTLIRELYWRDFFSHIGFHFPHVFKKSFNQKYNRLNWENDARKFKSWCIGSTGFPIVDAGMRELNKTGYMHNRVRMIVASFLTKDLHIDWHWGEKYFAKQLIDYDPAVNNGNWQWAASTGCDAQPYFRIFNPWLQQEKFDPECKYIKLWVPELEKHSSKEIHTLRKGINRNIYKQPIVDHAEAKEIAQELFSSL